MMPLIACWNGVGEAQYKTRQNLDSLSQQLSRQIESRQFRDSLDTIASIKSSGYDYEAEIFYFQGIAYLNIKQYSSAEAAFRVYIELSGPKGQYFQDALETIDHLETRLNNSQHSDDSGTGNNISESGNDEASVVGEVDSKICENLRIWHTSRPSGKRSATSKQHECGSHYILESDGKRKIIWQTKKRK